MDKGKIMIGDHWSDLYHLLTFRRRNKMLFYGVAIAVSTISDF